MMTYTKDLPNGNKKTSYCNTLRLPPFGNLLECLEAYFMDSKYEITDPPEVLRLTINCLEAGKFGSGPEFLPKSGKFEFFKNRLDKIGRSFCVRGSFPSG